MVTTLGHIASSLTGPGSSAPIPTAGLVFWWDADDPSSITLSGTDMVQWRDKSGGGHHMGVVTTAPTFSTDTIKAGRGSVDFPGTGHMSTEYGANQKPLSLFAVIKHAGGTAYRAVVGTFNGSGIEWRINNVNKQSFVKQQVVEIAVSTTAVPSGAAAIIGLTYSATGVWAYRLNSAADGTGTNDQSFASTSPKTRVGDALGEPFIGSIGEVIKYDRVVSGAEITQIESYLNTKWK
jgi:hypothetical protein